MNLIYWLILRYLLEIWCQFSLNSNRDASLNVDIPTSISRTGDANVRIVVQSSKLVLSVMCLELRTWLGHKGQENNGDGFKEENTGDRIDVERILCLARVQEKEQSLCSNDTYLDGRLSKTNTIIWHKNMVIYDKIHK